MHSKRLHSEEHARSNGTNVSDFFFFFFCVKISDLN